MSLATQSAMDKLDRVSVSAGVLEDSSRIIDERRNHYLGRGLGAAYVFNEGIGSFSVDDKEKHVFMCYSSDFDAHRERNFRATQ